MSPTELAQQQLDTQITAASAGNTRESDGENNS